ncbi:uncharacterized protein LOC125837987 [Solanum verrucosum]|uniref:uncharacterized protein LOC125837987 n=1 Tax=Solanum verrucosum TaxID=315347 RepID=UPI0020D0B031|nr:uncharacterized protein LOC125837987 [Solanum verrucosum]
MEFFLRRLKLTYALEKSCPEAPSSEIATDEATSIKEQIANAINLAEEASSNKFLISNYMEFKMVDDKSITEQVQEFQFITNKIAISGIALDENFHVGAIVSKLPLSWKEYRSKLIHKKEDFSLEQLLQHLQIEQETRYRDNNILK